MTTHCKRCGIEAFYEELYQGWCITCLFKLWQHEQVKTRRLQRELKKVHK